MGVMVRVEALTEKDINQFLVFQTKVEAESKFVKAISRKTMDLWLDKKLFTVFFIRVNGRIVSSVIFNRTVEPTRTVLFITQLVVLREFYGRGYASTLLSFLEQHAIQVNANAIMLGVERDNRKAIKLYKKRGFLFEPDSQGNYLCTKTLNPSIQNGNKKLWSKW